MSRTKKSLKNILAGLGFQAITILSNFICRTALIRYLGIDYVSLNGLFWEIVSMLSLVEMGIGSAIVYHLYKPIADGNIELIKKIMGFNIMDTAIYLFLTSKGYIVGRLAPIVVNDDLRVETYVNPIPSGLVLTGIVVSVSVTALMLAITVRLYKRYGTLDIDEIALSAKREEI